MAPETRYAKSGPYNIAYQVVGEGPFDLLFVSGFVSNVELSWDEPLLAKFLGRLASFSRLIVFDKRGTGLSDRVPLDRLPILEERMDDVRAVLDAAGSDRAALLGHSEGGNLAVLFSATYPSRTLALVTMGIFAKRVPSPDYPWAPTPRQRAADIEAIERDWGSDSDVDHLAPSAAADPAFRERLVAYFRRSASPGAAAALLRMNTEIDVTHVLPTIGVPTLVLHRTGDRDANVEEGRWIAAQIPGARFVELAGDDHLPWVGDQDSMLDEIEEFLTGRRPAAATTRVLTTVLFTDLVGSTRKTQELGDERWAALLERHDALIRELLRRYDGREVDTAGDGFLSTFDGPARAIRCAVEATRSVRGLGLELRAGVHTGEVELAGEKVRGIAVHTGARVASLAEAGQVLVTSTVKDLVAGSGIVFADRGVHGLDGVPGEWRLYAVMQS
jgi:pimeloyl-ACP methyl ester carboxylesterase